MYDRTREVHVGAQFRGWVKCVYYIQNRLRQCARQSGVRMHTVLSAYNCPDWHRDHIILVLTQVSTSTFVIFFLSFLTLVWALRFE